MLSKVVASSTDPYGSVIESGDHGPNNYILEQLDDSDKVSEDLLKSSTDNSMQFPGTTPLGESNKSKDVMEMDGESDEESDIEAKIDKDLDMDNIAIKSLAK